MPYTPLYTSTTATPTHINVMIIRTIISAIERTDIVVPGSTRTAVADAHVARHRGRLTQCVEIVPTQPIATTIISSPSPPSPLTVRAVS